jgi:hypothetical protein
MQCCCVVVSVEQHIEIDLTVVASCPKRVSYCRHALGSIDRLALHSAPKEFLDSMGPEMGLVQGWTGRSLARPRRPTCAWTHAQAGAQSRWSDWVKALTLLAGRAFAAGSYAAAPNAAPMGAAPMGAAPMGAEPESVPLVAGTARAMGASAADGAVVGASVDSKAEGPGAVAVLAGLGALLSLDAGFPPGRPSDIASGSDGTGMTQL